MTSLANRLLEGDARHALNVFARAGGGSPASAFPISPGEGHACSPRRLRADLDASCNVKPSPAGAKLS